LPRIAMPIGLLIDIFFAFKSASSSETSI
jgi:hypothetical protein